MKPGEEDTSEVDCSLDSNIEEADGMGIAGDGSTVEAGDTDTVGADSNGAAMDTVVL